MSLDLYERETDEALARAPRTSLAQVEGGIFDNFWSGTGRLAMRELGAKPARAISMAIGAQAVVADWAMGGTELQDRWFRQHDDLFGRAVDYWTPAPGEVGVAGEVVGTLAGMLPKIMLSPAYAVGEQVLSQSEDLVRKDAPVEKAIGVGMVQGAGLAAGIWMPILGSTLAQRVLLGGAGFNVAQGVTTRGFSQLILGDDKTAAEFAPFDGKMLTLDVLLGLAFGSWAHVNRGMRVQGDEAWQKLSGWAKGLEPADVDAIAALRQAQHLQQDSMPGIPKEPVDVENHVGRMRQALEQLVTGREVQVENLPEPRMEADTGQMAEMMARVRELETEGVRVAAEEGLPPPDSLGAMPVAPRQPAELFAEWRAGLKKKAIAQLLSIQGLEPLYQKAFEVEPKFRQIMEEFASRTGAEPLVVPVKGVDRAVQKVLVDYAGDAAQMKDMVRGSLVGDTINHAMDVFNTFVAENAPVGTVRNGLDPAAPVQTLDGYRDAKMNFVVDGLVTEVQVNVPEMIAAKNAMHKLYEAREKITRSAMKAGRDLTPREMARFEKLNAQMRAGYEEAWGKAMARNAASEMTVPLRAAESSGNQRSSESLQARVLPDGSSDTGTPSTSRNLVSAGKDGVPMAGIIDQNASQGQTPKALPREEISSDQPPAPGEPFIVYRLGSSEGLANRNAGNADAVARFIMGTEDPTGPVQSAATTVYAYKVTAEAPFGAYEGLRADRAAKSESIGRVTRGKEVAYSFPEKGYTVEPLGQVDVESLRARLADMGHEGFDGAGTNIGAQVIREELASKIVADKIVTKIQETGSPAVTRGDAVPPPPRGGQPAEAAGPTAPDPLQAAAQRFADDNPDLPVVLGQEPDGTPITRTAREYLEDARLDAEQARQDLPLFEAAAQCLLGGGG